jgi:hypothetical protein
LVDLLLVGEVLREVRARPVEHGDEHDALAPFGMVFEQCVEGVEPAHDVLGEVDAVAAQQELAPSHQLVELGGGLGGGL